MVSLSLLKGETGIRPPWFQAQRPACNKGRSGRRSSGPGRQAIVLRFLSGPKRMLGGAARNIASVRAIFLGSHPALSPPLKEEYQSNNNGLASGFRGGYPGPRSPLWKLVASTLAESTPSIDQTGPHMTLAFAPERIEHWPLPRLQPYAKLLTQLQAAPRVPRSITTFSARSSLASGIISVVLRCGTIATGEFRVRV